MTDPRLFVGRHPSQRQNADQHGDDLVALADMLLALGGDKVVTPHDDPNIVGLLLRLVLDKGRVFDAAGATLELGEPSECHANVVALWRAGRGTACTGFALSQDGLWRSHSWLVEPSGRIVETTERRIAYFGYAFDDEGTEIFFAAHL